MSNMLWTLDYLKTFDYMSATGAAGKTIAS